MFSKGNLLFFLAIRIVKQSVASLKQWWMKAGIGYIPEVSPNAWGRTVILKVDWWIGKLV